MVAQVNRLVIKSFGIVFVLCALLAGRARADVPSLLIDDESETFLANVVRPIFKVAGIAFDPNRVHILDDMSLNAFISDGNHLFVHAGTLIAAQNVNEITGILAHETGHIAGGHILRQKLKMQDLRTLSAISLITAGALGAAAGRGDAAIAVAIGTQGSLLNSLTAYQLQEERSADESAVRYLKALGQSPKGLKNFMKTVQRTNRLSGYEEVPYFRTHPLSAERLSFFDNAVLKNGGRVESAYDKDFLFVKAKLTAFLLPIDRALNKYPAKNQNVYAKYAHAIIKFRQKRFNEAIALIDQLIKEDAKNPYFYQLKGQFLFESGKVQEALAAFRQALALKPDSTETILMYAACALEAKNNKDYLDEVILMLSKIQTKDENASAWQLLSRAYFERKMEAESFYALARFSLMTGNVDVAERQMNKAMSLKPSAALKIKLSDLAKEIRRVKKFN